jgi:hypothetical protein
LAELEHQSQAGCEQYGRVADQRHGWSHRNHADPGVAVVEQHGACHRRRPARSDHSQHRGNTAGRGNDSDDDRGAAYADQRPGADGELAYSVESDQPVEHAERGVAVAQDVAGPKPRQERAEQHAGETSGAHGVCERRRRPLGSHGQHPVVITGKGYALLLTRARSTG